MFFLDEFKKPEEMITNTELMNAEVITKGHVIIYYLDLFLREGEQNLPVESVLQKEDLPV